MIHIHLVSDGGRINLRQSGLSTSSSMQTLFPLMLERRETSSHISGTILGTALLPEQVLHLSVPLLHVPCKMPLPPLSTWQTPTHPPPLCAQPSLHHWAHGRHSRQRVRF